MIKCFLLTNLVWPRPAPQNVCPKVFRKQNCQTHFSKIQKGPKKRRNKNLNFCIFSFKSPNLAQSLKNFRDCTVAQLHLLETLAGVGPQQLSIINNFVMFFESLICFCGCTERARKVKIKTNLPLIHPKSKLIWKLQE